MPIKTRTRWVSSHYRAHHDVGQRDGSTGAIIKTCIVFFPSLWVSCNTIVWIVTCYSKNATTSIGWIFASLSLILWSLTLFFLCPDMSLPLWSPVGECPLVGWFLSVSWHVPPSVVSSQWVPLGWLVGWFLSVSWHVPPSVASSRWVLLGWLVSFCTMALFLCLPSPGSKHAFNLLVYFWCTNMFLPPYISQEVGLSFVFACSLFSHWHFFASVHHRY